MPLFIQCRRIFLNKCHSFGFRIEMSNLLTFLTLIIEMALNKCGKFFFIKKLFVFIFPISDRSSQ